MNSVVYQIAGLVLQAAQVHNVTVPGGHKYNVPSGNIAIDQIPPSQDGSVSNLTSYTTAVISGADDFVDSKIIIEDVFDIIVNTTREVTPTCMFPLLARIYLSY